MNCMLGEVALNRLPMFLSRFELKTQEHSQRGALLKTLVLTGQFIWREEVSSRCEHPQWQAVRAKRYQVNLGGIEASGIRERAPIRALLQ